MPSLLNNPLPTFRPLTVFQPILNVFESSRLNLASQASGKDELDTECTIPNIPASQLMNGPLVLNTSLPMTTQERQ